MTKKQKEQEIQLIISELNNGGYAKGWGQYMCRLMDKNHSPITIVRKDNILHLLETKQIVLQNLIYIKKPDHE